MSEPFLAEIRLAAFGFPPKGWALCNGQLLPINQNQALFALLGTNFGGDGRINFALPNLQGRAAFHVGNGLVLGQSGGEMTHTLNVQEMPAHTHPVSAAATASTPDPTGALWAGGGVAAYVPQPNTLMDVSTVSTAGSTQPHENRPPYLGLCFIIALQGIFPSQN